MATYFSPSRFVGGTSLGNLYVRLTVDPQGFVSGMSSAQNSVTGMTDSLAGLAKAAGVAIAAFGAVAAVAIKEYAEFDKAMTNSLSIMEGVNAGMRAQMEETAKSISLSSTKSATELAEGYFFLASAGLDAAQSMKALPVVAKMATAGTISMTEATNELVNAQAALGLTSKDADENMRQMARIADVLAKADMEATGTIEEFAEALTNKAAASMRQFGVSLEEGMSVLMAFAQQGLRGRAAGEAFSMFLRDVQKAAIKNKEVFEDLGVAVYDTAGQIRYIPDILQDMEKAFAGASDETKRATLTLMGFQDRSLRSIMSLMGMSDQVRKFHGEVKNAGGTLDTIFAKQMQSFTAGMTVAWHEIQKVLIEIGAGLAPTITELGIEVVSLVKAFGEWNTQTGALLGMLTTLIDTVKVFILGLLTIWSALKAVAITIAAQVTVAFQAFSQALETGIQLAKLMWDALKNLADAYISVAKAAAGFGAAMFKAAVGDYGGAKKAVSDAVVGIYEGFQKAGDIMTETASKAFDAVTKGADKLAPVVDDVLRGAFQDLSGELDNLVAKYEKLFPSDEEKAARVKKFMDAIKQGVNGLADAYKKAGEAANQAGDNMMSKADQVLNSKKVEALMRLIGAPTTTRDIQTVSTQRLLDSISMGQQGGLNTAEAERMLKEAGLTGSQSVVGMMDPEMERATQISREIELEQNRLKILQDLAKMEMGIKKEVLEQNEKNMIAYNERIKQLHWAQAQVVVQSGQQTFDLMAQAAEGFAGKQSALYKSMFAMSKAFAIAEAIIKIQQAAAQVMGDPALPWAAKLVAYSTILAQGATIANAINATKLTFAGEKAEGGPVTGGKAYLIGERGPEMFVPGKSGSIIPNDQLGAGRGDTKVIVNNYTDAQATVTEKNNGQEKVLEVLVKRVKNEISSEIRDGRGDLKRSLESTYRLRRGQQ